MKIDLVRDCLDKQVVDRENRKMGRVDGIVLEIAGPGRPHVIGIEIGPTTLTRRLPRPFRASLGALIRNLSDSHTAGVSVAWSKISIVRNEVRVDLDGNQTDARLFETWVRERIIRRIPGA